MTNHPFSVRSTLILIVSWLSITPLLAANITRLRVNRQSRPTGIQRTACFSWQVESSKQDVRQVAYAITVATTRAGLNGGREQLWNSGRVESSETLQVPYQGRKLPYGADILWQVEVWLSSGEHVTSPVQHFLTGMKMDRWEARWIGVNDFEHTIVEDGRRDLPARYLRHEFDVPSRVKRAVLYISGMGHSAAYLNGQLATPDVFGTVQSDWDKTVYYNTIDVTSLVQKGRNAIGVVLGNGFTLGLRPNYRNFGGPRLMAQLVVETAADTLVIPTDTSWKATNRGPIRRNNLYDGELYDARQELGNWDRAGYDDSRWQAAEVMPTPMGTLKPQPNPGIRTQHELYPIDIRDMGEGRYLIDMGQNMAGQLRATLTAKAGQAVILRHAELLTPAGDSLYTANLRSALCTNTYIPRADGRFTYQPLLVYQGFRFVEVTGLAEMPRPEDITGLVQYDEMEECAGFECDNELLNRLHSNALWGIRGNYHGMPTDCPQRDERLGWTGDRLTGCYGENILMDNGALYYKWLHDLVDSQNEAGQIAHLTPEYRKGRHDGVTWPGAFVYATYMLYRRYGDLDAVYELYPYLQKWVNYTYEKTQRDGILTVDRYGDWCMPPEQESLIHSKDPARKTEGAVLSTTVFYDILRMMGEMATRIGNHSDASYYARMAAHIKAAYNKTYFNAEKGQYSNNTVTANILSLELGLVPQGFEEKVMKNIVEVTEQQFDGHVSCGVLGIQHLMRGLTHHGQLDLAWRIVNQRSFPSYGYMIEHGATTIWELWNGNTADPAMNSANHVMLLGDLLLWYYEDLAGIRNAEGSLGYTHLDMAPCFPEELHHVKAWQRTATGLVRSEWTRQDDSLSWQIEIPANATATIRIPQRFGIRPTEGGAVHAVKEQDDCILVEVGSGRHTFVSNSK